MRLAFLGAMDAMDATQAETTGSLDELRDLLNSFDTAMLVTATPERRLRARPMAIQAQPLDDCDLWFVTAEATAKTEEIRGEEHVNVCCFRARDRAYISISALARIDGNSETVRRLWRPEWKIWLPEGIDEGKICILKLNIEHADYWQPEGGRVRIVYSILKAIVDEQSIEKNLNPVKRI